MNKEIWKDIPEYKGLYQINNYGKVRSLKRIDKIGRLIPERILKERIDKKGYIHYALNKNGKTKEFKAHRLVAQVFLNYEHFKFMEKEKKQNFDINKLQINHKDENKQNNYVDNLEYCTNYYNFCYSKNGEKNKIKVNMYDKNNKFIKSFSGIREAGRIYNIKPSSICNCCKGKLKTAGGYKWKYVE